MRLSSIRRASGAVVVCAVGTVALTAGQASASSSTAFAFDLRFADSQNLFSFPVNSPNTQTQIGPIGGLASLGYTTHAMDFNTAGTVLHVVNQGPGAPNQLGTVDVVTGAYSPGPTLTGVAATVASFSGLSMDPTTETLYLSSTDRLFTVDPTTGATTLVASFADVTGAPVGLVIDISIDNFGNLFAHDITTDRLWAVDKTTGVSIPRPNSHGLAANFAQGMDFDPETNLLHAAIYVSGGNGSYGTWDTTTGSFTQILALPSFVDPSGNGRELEIAIRAIPEPTSIATLGVMGLALVRRTRRPTGR